MRITVETGKWAARYVNDRAMSIEVPGGATVADVIRTVGIPADEAGLAVLGGNAISNDYSLSDGDVINVHPVIIGG